MFFRKKQDSGKDQQRNEKIRASQLSLLAAATSTADIAHDVTMKLRERLDDSLRQLEVTASLINDALFVCDYEGTIVSFNKAAGDMFGIGEDIVGKKIHTLIDNESGISENGLLWGRFNRATHPCESDNSCMKAIRGNGERFYIDGDVTYLERIDGSITVMVLIKDVSTRIEIQKQLQVEELRYRTIFESSFDGIIVVQNGEIVAANPASTGIFNSTTDDLLNRKLSQFISFQFRKELDGLVEDTANSLNEKNHLVVKSSGDFQKKLLISLAPMKWNQQKAALLSIKDISSLTDW